MTSRVIQCRDAAIALLNTDRESGIAEATKRRAFPGVALQGPCIGVFLGPEPTSYPRGNTSSPVVVRERLLVVQIGVISESVEDLDDLAEEQRAWVVEKLGDTNLGGLALSVEDRGIPAPDGVTVWNADVFNMLVYQTFAVRYQTNRSDIEAAQ